MAVDFENRGVASYADVVGSDADHGAILLMRFIDGNGAAGKAGLVKEPEIAEFGKERTWDRLQVADAEVRDDPVQKRQK